MCAPTQTFSELHLEGTLWRFHYTGMVDKSLAFGDWTHSPAPLSSQEVVWWDWNLQPSNQGWFPSNQLQPQGLPKSHPININLGVKGFLLNNERRAHHSGTPVYFSSSVPGTWDKDQTYFVLDHGCQYLFPEFSFTHSSADIISLCPSTPLKWFCIFLSSSYETSQEH